MFTLYFSPGACSMASHIALEETGAPYQKKPTLLARGEQKTEAYLKINPRGKVPALSVDGKILVENTAILTYLARQFPEKKLIYTAWKERMLARPTVRKILEAEQNVLVKTA